MTSIPQALHDNPWHTRAVRVDNVREETDGVKTYRLIYADAKDGDSYDFVPGQFNMLYMPGVGESAISMSGNASKSDSWIHTVRVAGNVTRTLAELGQGDTLGLRGPFGTGWPVDEMRGNDVVIVAGGLGIAPLRPLIYYVINHRDLFGRVWVISGARAPESLLYQNEYHSWRSRGIDVRTTVDRMTAGWTGHIGVVTLLIERLQLDLPRQTSLVACGPEVMMKYAAIAGVRIGISTERIWLSLERNMQCAVGLCGHCQLGPEFICKDGPVLRFDRIRNYLIVEQL